MTGLDTITPTTTHTTRRTVDPIGSRSRHESDAHSPGASFDDVLAQTSREASTLSDRSASASRSAQAREQAAEAGDTAESAASAESADSAEETAQGEDRVVANSFQKLTKQVDVTDGQAPDGLGVDPRTTDARNVEATESADVAAEMAATLAATLADAEGAAIDSSGDASVDASGDAPQADPALAIVSGGAATTTAAASATNAASDATADAAAAPRNSVAAATVPVDATTEAPADDVAIVAATSNASAGDAGDGGVESEIDSALLQAAARTATEEAAATRPTEAQARRTPQVAAVDTSASSDLAGLDASSGDQAAPEIAPTLTAAQRGTEASTRLTEHVAMREMFDRIERHRSSIDGSIELEILTERFGSIRIEAAEGRDGVHLSLRGGNGDERALADLADELRQEFERNGVDLAGLDVGDRNGSRPGAASIEGTGDSLAMSEDTGLDDSPLHHLGGDAGRLDLRL